MFSIITWVLPGFDYDTFAGIFFGGVVATVYTRLKYGRKGK
jgi:hypothetical protein